MSRHKTRVKRLQQESMENARLRTELAEKDAELSLALADEQQWKRESAKFQERLKLETARCDEISESLHCAHEHTAKWEAESATWKAKAEELMRNE